MAWNGRSPGVKVTGLPYPVESTRRPRWTATVLTPGRSATTVNAWSERSKRNGSSSRRSVYPAVSRIVPQRWPSFRLESVRTIRVPGPTSWFTLAGSSENDPVRKSGRPASSRPSPAAATMPSASPETRIGRLGSAVRIMGVGSATGITTTGAGWSASTGLLRVCWSRRGRSGPATFGTGSPNPTRGAKPGASRTSAHRSAGRGVRNRSNCKSDRRTTSPTPMRRANGARASASRRPSWISVSRATSSAADAGEP